MAQDRTVYGRIVSLGADHVVVRGGVAVGDWVVPTSGLAFVLTRPGRRYGTRSSTTYLDARRELFAP